MGTSLGPKYIPYTYMDPLGSGCQSNNSWQSSSCGISRFWPAHRQAHPGTSARLGFRLLSIEVSSIYKASTGRGGVS